MDLTEIRWEGAAMPKDGCEVCQCSRLITDKFRINSGGKSPDHRRRESAAACFSSRMAPTTLARAFAHHPPSPLATIHNNTTQNMSRDAWCVGRTECKTLRLDCCQMEGDRDTDDENDKENRSMVCSHHQTTTRHHDTLNSPLKRKIRRRGSQGITPSKFSVVRNSLNLSRSVGTPNKCPDLLDFASRDSGFENSAGAFHHLNTATSASSSSSSRLDIHEELAQSACQFEETFHGHFDKMEHEQTDHLAEDTRGEDYEFDVLHDLEEEFDGSCPTATMSKYEIISTDSPDIVSGRSISSRILYKTRNFDFGSPIGDVETSEDFGDKNTQPQKTLRRMPARSETTRMLNFDSPSLHSHTPQSQPTVSHTRTDRISEINSSIFKTIITDKTFRHRSPRHSREYINTQGDDTPIKQSAADAIKYYLSPLHSRVKIEPAQSQTKNRLRLEKDPPPGSRRSRLFESLSTGSLDSGCLPEDVIEEDDCSMLLEDQDRQKSVPSSFHSLISWEIKSGLASVVDDAETSINFEDCDRDEVDRPDDCKMRLFGSIGDESSPESTVVPIRRRPAFRRCISQGEEGVLHGFKRPLGAGTMASKRRRHITDSEMAPNRPRPVLQRAMSDNGASIKMALARSYTEPDLIGDFSTSFVLPVVPGEHSDLRSIASDTLADLISGKYQHRVQQYQIIDCRYPYEYEGGHIEGAHNLYSEEMVKERLLPPPPSPSDCLSPSHQSEGQAKRKILIFHCEFSTQRGPKLCRYLRACDRSLHLDSYPRLAYPEVYLLQGGYRSFHSQHAALCKGDYTPMLDPKYDADMRSMRARLEQRRPVF